MSAGSTLTLSRPDRLEVPSLLVRLTGPMGELTAPLGLRALVIGSASECDVVLADPGVSRRHCELVLGERGVEVRDLGSKNGTFVRDISILAARLELGVPVTIGSSRLVVQQVGAPEVVLLSLAPTFGHAVGESARMRALFAQLERFAVSETTLTLRGETGTGKELLARELHRKSTRREGPFEVLDCGAIAPAMLEAELFGWERGAFTGAVDARDGALVRAEGGTLFLDGIDELGLEAQPALLRALDAKEVRPLGSNRWRRVDVRLVCATHADLRQRVRDGAFREDLFYRVAVAHLEVPPLRQRKDDLPRLVEHWLAAQSPPRSLADLPPTAMALLLGHDWPGNVRELHNTLARWLVLPDLPAELGIEGSGAARSRTELHGLSLRDARELVVEQFERHFLSARLREHHGNVSRAAEAMGVSRQFLHRLLERYGIARDRT